MAEMSRRDWLLLLFDGARSAIDRVRIQKAMFLFAKRSKAPESQKYKFEAYNYGPFSFEIYPDLDALSLLGLLKQESVAWMSSPVYSLSPRGEQAVLRLRSRAPEPRLLALARMREYVMARNFNDLLKDIYRLYPEYATRTVFRS